MQAAVRSKGHEVDIGGELFSDAMGDPGTEEGTYVGMVRHNIDTVVSALLGVASVRGFPALATLISFLLGLIIVMLGVIGEYLWRIADETNRRPEAVIDEIY